MDPPGIYMLKSIREIFQMVELDIEDVQFNLESFTITDMIKAIEIDMKCPVITASRVSESLHCTECNFYLRASTLEEK